MTTNRIRSAPKPPAVIRRPGNPPAGKPFPLTNAACPRHDTPVLFSPSTRNLFCPTCAARRFISAAAGKAVRP